MPDPQKNNNIDTESEKKGPRVVSAENAPLEVQAELSKINYNLTVKSNNPYASAAPLSYDSKNVTDPNKNFERFYSHGDYNKLGFNPWRDNETLYNEKGSALGDVWRATQSAQKLAVTGFLSPLRSYADLFTGNALVAV